MGVTTSSVSPNSSANETIHNLYKKNEYKWSPGQIAANIRRGKVTPIYNGTTERERDNRCFCSICYYFYPKINETTCCGQGICTECLAAVASPPPKERCCPFCRKENYSIIPNVEYKQLKNPFVNDEEPLQNLPDTNENLPDDVIALLMQFPNIDQTTVVQLYNDGMSTDQIIEFFELQ
ncbi:hypothetical protein M9Y10_022053 [Tritrichomonas musculus]|uniref:RING-type domain-containing protein n=1 Tax=Tritrichomonas musculus TaxID=1915356 RepID=A0ABR2KS24_9EUKA